MSINVDSAEPDGSIATLMAQLQEAATEPDSVVHLQVSVLLFSGCCACLVTGSCYQI